MFLSMQVAYAANDQFEIAQQIISSDNEPPTTPVNVNATAVATDQIDITWDASTDNVGVTGYQVFRDGFQIATSVATSYSDIGLTENTTYDYNIRAFDAVFNFSTSSATSSATTFALQTTPASSGGNSVIPRLSNLEVNPEEFAATIGWNTIPVTKAMLRWGLTEEYELGSLSERSYSENHGTRITGLDPGTTYHFEISGIDEFNQEYIFHTGTFTTLSLPDTEAPPNVSNLEGSVVNEHDVLLTWQNPDVEDFSHVRIVRSDTGYPLDPNDGKLVYEGSDELFIDEEAVRLRSTQFYAVFAYDEVGNTSSGAVIFVRKIALTEDGGIREDGVLIPTPGSEGEIEDTIKLRFEDLIFRQGNQELSFIGNEVSVDSNKALTIEIPYERLPEHLKTIVATFTDPEDKEKTFSFLLRVNEGKTFYRAVIDAFSRDGAYPLTVTVFDFKNRTLTTTEGVLTAAAAEEVGERKTFSLREAIESFLRSLGIWLWILLPILLIVFVIYIREHIEQKGRY